MKRPPPKKPTAMREVVRMLAQLGGFLARKGDGEPGSETETLWRGYMIPILHQSIAAIKIAATIGKRE